MCERHILPIAAVYLIQQLSYSCGEERRTVRRVKGRECQVERSRAEDGCGPQKLGLQGQNRKSVHHDHSDGAAAIRLSVCESLWPEKDLSQLSMFCRALRPQDSQDACF